MTEDVLIASRGTVLEIVLNRPDKGNALTAEMAGAITATLKALPGETRVVLLRANGADFCTGRSAAMPAARSRATALDLRALISDPVLDFYTALREIPVPFIAAVRGKAAGVGCALAALADVAVAADSAVFQVPEMNHDIAPTLVMNALADRISRAALARMVLTRDPVGAAEAKSLGLVGMVVDDGALYAEVTRIAGQLEKNSVPVVRGIKAFLSMSPETSFASRTELAALINSSVTAECYR